VGQCDENQDKLDEIRRNVCIAVLICNPLKSGVSRQSHLWRAYFVLELRRKKLYELYAVAASFSSLSCVCSLTPIFCTIAKK